MRGGTPSEGRDLVVTFTSAQARQRAHKMVRRPPRLMGHAGRRSWAVCWAACGG